MTVICKLMNMSSSMSLTSGCRLSSSWLALALLPILEAGCAGTFHEVTTLSPGRPPAERPAVLVLGEVQVTDARLSTPEKDYYRFKFEQGVQAWFSKTNIFESVVSSTNLPPHSISLTGTITEVEPAST